MEGDKFEKEVCDLRCTSLKNCTKNLEVRIFETLKKISQLSDMAHDGHKTALKSSIISMQKDFEISYKDFENIKKDLQELEEALKNCNSISKAVEKDNIYIKNSLKVEQNKVKYLIRIVYCLGVLIGLYILTGEDLSKLLTIAVRLFSI